MLDPARFRVVLGEFALGGRDYVGVLIEDNGTGGGGALVQRNDKFLSADMMFSTFLFSTLLHRWGGPLSGGGLFFVRQLGGFFGGDAVARDAGASTFTYRAVPIWAPTMGPRMGTQK